VRTKGGRRATARAASFETVSVTASASAGPSAAEHDSRQAQRTETVIRTDGLTKRYPKVTALDRLGVNIEPGVIGLVGANGAGKSTLIKLLLGLAPASDGTASVLGLNAAAEGRAIREQVGYMPEHDCLPPDVSATEFVVHMARMSGLPRTSARERTADTLRHVGLYEERYRPIGGYSTGMRQRVKLAQALVHDPRLVLLDEPTNGLDPAGRDAMLALIHRIGTEFGISIVVCSHLLGEVERICTGLIAIDGGRLLRYGSMAALTVDRDVLLVEVDEGTDQLAVALAARGLHVGRDGRVLMIAAGSGSDGSAAMDGDEAADIIVATVADLELPLHRLDRQRRRLSELFTTEPERATADV
jgi:ABC-2 type transport system ATP-binding protein